MPPPSAMYKEPSTGIRSRSSSFSFSLGLILPLWIGHRNLAPVKFLAGARGRPMPHRLAPVIRLDEGSILAKGIRPIHPQSPGIRRSLPQMLTGIREFELDSGSNPRLRPLQEDLGELLVLQDLSYLLLVSCTELASCTTVRPCSVLSPVISGDRLGAATPLVGSLCSSGLIPHHRMT
jgi:hypothetical protein